MFLRSRISRSRRLLAFQCHRTVPPSSSCIASRRRDASTAAVLRVYHLS
ncbi:hypothetical protein ACP4OV_006942 [Aristida adscensionis]